MNRILIIDGNRGRYIPQQFFLRYADEQIHVFPDALGAGEGSLADARKECGDPDNEYYWETWVDFCQNATITIDGQDYQLEEDGDLWGIPIQWRAMSPDGFDIRMDTTYKSLVEAHADCKAWLDAIINFQGYYLTSDRTRLSREDAYALCEFEIYYPDDFEDEEE